MISAVILTSIFIIILNRKVISFYTFFIVLYSLNYFVFSKFNENFSNTVFIRSFLYINIGYLLLILFKKTQLYVRIKKEYFYKYPIIKFIKISLVNIKSNISSLKDIRIKYLTDDVAKIFYKSLQNVIDIYNAKHNI